MPKEHEIRADYDRETIVVYQAYSDAIADAALTAGRFVTPFSFGRMTWIKPSFLWLMHRSNWGQKSGQQRTLAVRNSRTGWEEALSMAVLTTAEPNVYANRSEWQGLFRNAKVHLQWDPERSLRGASLPHYSIQVGLSRHVIRNFAEEWTKSISDLTPLVTKLRGLIAAGHADKAARLLPPERVYPLAATIGKRILLD